MISFVTANAYVGKVTLLNRNWQGLNCVCKYFGER